jgi:hypothetical protein
MFFALAGQNASQKAGINAGTLSTISLSFYAMLTLIH